MRSVVPSRVNRQIEHLGDVEGVLWVDLDRSRNGSLLDDHGESGGGGAQDGGVADVGQAGGAAGL